VADDPRISAALDRARQLLGPRLEEAAGSRISGEIPVSEALLNRLIAQKLLGSEGALASAELQVRPSGDVLVRLRVRRPSFAPAVIVALHIERQPAPPVSMELGLKWSIPGLGLLAALAAPVVSFFKKPPAGIRIEGDLLIVDLAAIASSQGVGALLEFVTGLTITSRDGALVVAFELRIPDAPVKSSA